MKKRFALILSLLLVALCACALADVEINEASFPDEKFRGYVEDVYDKDHDMILTDLEMANAVSMNVNWYDIKDLTGIQLFPNLTELDCSYNQLSTLDLSGNTALTTVTCDGNADEGNIRLTSLNVSKNTELTFLSCSNNELTVLDLSNNTLLTEIECDNNKLISLVLSDSEELTALYCYNNQLATLDLSRSKGLTTLVCSGNKLTQLDLSSVPKLSSIDCLDNNLKELDIRPCKVLLDLATKSKRQEDTGYYFWENDDDATLYIDQTVKLITADPEEPTPPENPEASSYADHTGSYQVSSTGTATFTAPRKNVKKVTVPASVKVDGKTVKVTEIAAGAFKNNKKLTEVKVGANVKTIGQNAFSGCTSLTSVIVPKKVTTIGQNAFNGCSKLTKIKLDDINITSIGANAFKDCASLKSIVIPRKIKSIGKNAFNGCKKLKTIIIQTTSLATVGKDAFKDINTNATIYVPSSKYKTYDNLLRKRGLAKSVKIRKQ